MSLDGMRYGRTILCAKVFFFFLNIQKEFLKQLLLKLEQRIIWIFLYQFLIDATFLVEMIYTGGLLQSQDPVK